MNFLRDRLGPALARSGLSAESVSSPEALHRQPLTVAAPAVRAYAESLGQVFLWAATIAAVAFVLALFLREVPLRDIHNIALDVGDGFGMPTTETPEKLLENTIGRMLCAAIPVCDCAASPCAPIAGSTSPVFGDCCASTAISSSSERPGSPTSVTTWGCPSRSWSPPSAEWLPRDMSSATAIRCR
ncbi:squalene-hopene cyclase domain protein [Mycobacterium kansasii 732]|nr:squalene-hopene cyclase domain protein [Mycobacterium kansasii 732]